MLLTKDNRKVHSDKRIAFVFALCAMHFALCSTPAHAGSPLHYDRLVRAEILPLNWLRRIETDHIQHGKGE